MENNVEQFFADISQLNFGSNRWAYFEVYLTRKAFRRKRVNVNLNIISHTYHCATKYQNKNLVIKRFVRQKKLKSYKSEKYISIFRVNLKNFSKIYPKVQFLDFIIINVDCPLKQVVLVFGGNISEFPINNSIRRIFLFRRYTQFFGHEKKKSLAINFARRSRKVSLQSLKYRRAYEAKYK